MSHRFDSLLLRGVFGLVLGLAVLAGAATQAIGFHGDIVLRDGRLELVPAPMIQCAQAHADADDAHRRG